MVSWPQWERLPDGGSGGHGDEDFFAVCGASDDFLCVVTLCRDVSLVFVEADLETDLRTKTDRPAESGDLKQEKPCCHI